VEFGGFRRTSGVAVAGGVASNAHARRRAVRRGSRRTYPEDQQIHPAGMLPPYRGFGEPKVATALVATPASLQAGTELNLHKGTRYLQPIEVFGIDQTGRGSPARRQRDYAVKTGCAATLRHVGARRHRARPGRLSTAYPRTRARVLLLSLPGSDHGAVAGPPRSPSSTPLERVGGPLSSRRLVDPGYAARDPTKSKSASRVMRRERPTLTDCSGGRPVTGSGSSSL
jgi:hypothetical protein